MKCHYLFSLPLLLLVTSAHAFDRGDKHREVEIKRSFIHKDFEPISYTKVLLNALTQKINTHGNVKQAIREAVKLEQYKNQYAKSQFHRVTELDNLTQSKVKTIFKNGMGQFFYWEFPPLERKPYFIDDKVGYFIFLDNYFDTEDRSLLKSGKSIRARTRWKSFFSYYLYRYFEYFNPSTITRCEIQAKGNYQFKGSLVMADELRFEFSDIQNDKSPQNHLSFCHPHKLNNILQDGTFKDKEIAPYSYIKTHLKTKPLHSIMTIKTIRHRFHLNMHNPWGVGGNPEQIILITLDVSSCISEDNCSPSFRNNKLIELEIELSKNISMGLDQSLQDDSITPELKKEMLFNVKNIKDAILADMKKIESIAVKLLTQSATTELTERKSKYQRFTKL